MEKTFRILSIDGGGIKGVFPAAFLRELQTRLDNPVIDYFDLIAGTSTGGILAIGLGLGMAPSDMLRLYRESGHSIFPRSQSLIAKTKHYFINKYSADQLKKVLEATFQEKLLGDSKKRLIIPSFSALTGKPYVFKTAHHQRFESDWRRLAVDVAMATSAAPTYFPAFVTQDFIPHLDGGIWANNPTGHSVVEAIGVLDANPTDVRVLSLGCTCEPQNFDLKRAGLWGWRTKALAATFSGQSFGSMGIATTLAGTKNIQRVDPVVKDGRFSLDNPRLVDELEGRGTECAREELTRFRDLFDHGRAEPFTPLYRYTPAQTSSHCPRCGGSGTVTCPRCDGSGTEITLAVIATHCPHCHGRGEIKCPRCNGTGNR